MPASGNGDDVGGLISRGYNRRISRVVSRLDGAAPPPLARPVGAAPYNPGILRARVTVVIPTGTDSAPSSSGKVRLKVQGPTGTWGDGEEVQVYNDFTFSPSLPINRMVKVAWIAGDYWLVSASCS